MTVWDELRFGPERTLNLRENLPTTADAVRRAERWLREKQVQDAGEVLLITGRGAHSIDGIAAIRQAIAKLLGVLRRKGVVMTFQEHNPGAYAVQLAPIRTLLESSAATAITRPALSVAGLDRQTNELLRELAERSLDALGVTATAARVEDEMHRHLRTLVPAISGPEVEASLRQAIRTALSEYD